MTTSAPRSSVIARTVSATSSAAGSSAADAPSSRVVVGGFFQGEATPVRLGEEFHHNRVQIVGSQISGVAPALQHRWDELRMSRTALELERSGQLRLSELISHRVPAQQAPEMFDLLDTRPDAALQVVLDYRARQ